MEDLQSAQVTVRLGRPWRRVKGGPRPLQRQASSPLALCRFGRSTERLQQDDHLLWTGQARLQPLVEALRWEISGKVAA